MGEFINLQLEVVAAGLADFGRLVNKILSNYYYYYDHCIVRGLISLIFLISNISI